MDRGLRPSGRLTFLGMRSNLWELLLFGSPDIYMENRLVGCGFCRQACMEHKRGGLLCRYVRGCACEVGQPEHSTPIMAAVQGRRIRRCAGEERYHDKRGHMARQCLRRATVAQRQKREGLYLRSRRLTQWGSGSFL